MRSSCIWTALAVASTLAAAPDIFPLKDVRAGQHAVGRTVFAGSRVEEFQVEILGVLRNIGPQQSIILARLSGGPLAETGVLQGMSGSPVYIEGKLAGAVALGFTQSKAAIAGIRPIEEMLRVDPLPKTALASASPPPRLKYVNGDVRLEEIATPVSFSGFSAATLEHFGPQLRELGLDPRQGTSGGGTPPEALGDPKTLEPGSMISVQLLSGDFTVSADGTITAIDGNQIYAFGHRFLASGPTEMPFARAEVLALLPNLASSFKISQASEWMGSITADRDVAISGLTGRRANLIPMEIRLGKNTYRMNVVQDKLLTPLVAQMAVFSTLDTTQRSIGASTYAMRGYADFEGGTVKLDNVYSGDVNMAANAAAGVAQPLAFALGSGFDALKLKNIHLEIEPLEAKKQWQIVDMSAPRQVRPGDDLEFTVAFTGENGAETLKKARYHVPTGAPLGPLYLTVSDAATANVPEVMNAMGTPARSPVQVFSVLNNLRPNTSAYVRVWRADTAFTVDGKELPDAPASVALVLGRAPIPGTNLVAGRGSKVGELEIAFGDSVVTGAKTIQVEVKD